MRLVACSIGHSPASEIPRPGDVFPGACLSAEPGVEPFALISVHPGGNPGANLKSISHRCYLREVAFEWELTKETIYFPLGCLQGVECFSAAFLSSPARGMHVAQLVPRPAPHAPPTQQPPTVSPPPPVIRGRYADFGRVSLVGINFAPNFAITPNLLLGTLEALI